MRRRHHGQRIYSWALAAALASCSSLAHADTHTLTGAHVTQKSPEKIWSILTAYPDICAKGCRYERPNLIRVKKVSYLASETSWYTWSHVENAIRDVTYFSKVTINWRENGDFTTDTLQLNDSHRELIDALKKKTGLDHRPAFDTANTTTTVRKSGERTQVTQKVVLTSSGLLDLWPAKVLAGIREHMEATFRNIGP